MPPLSSTVPVGATATHRIYTAQSPTTTIASIVAEVGSAVTTVELFGVISYGSVTTVPPSITLDLTNGMIDCSFVANAVTIQGPIIAPLGKQIFTNCVVITNALSRVTSNWGINFTGNSRLGAVSPCWWGAVGDGVTSCKPAFDAMFEALKTAGGGSVIIPTGTWVWDGSLNTPGSGGGVQGAQYSDTFTREGSNITVQGMGRDATTILYPSLATSNGIKIGLPRADRNRYSTTFNPPDNVASPPSYGLPTFYPFQTVKAGSLTVTLTNVGDAAVFAAVLAAGQTVIFLESARFTSNGNSPAYYEYNYIKAVDTNTGVITLVNPLTDDYQTTDTNWPPYLAPISVLPHDIVIRDLTFRGQSVSATLVGVYGVRKVWIENVAFRNGFTFSGFDEDVSYINCLWEFDTNFPNTHTPYEMIDATKRLRFIGNTTIAYKGQAHLASKGAQIIGNTFFGSAQSGCLGLIGADVNPGTVPLHMHVEGNLFYASGAASGVFITNNNSINFINNRIRFAHTSADSVVGVVVDNSANRINIIGNDIEAANLTSGTGTGIRFRVTASSDAQSDVYATGNVIKVGQFGLRVNPITAGTIDRLTVVNNRILNAATPQVLTGATNVTTDASLNQQTLVLAPITAPGAPTAALAGLGAGDLSNGAYSFRVTLTTATGETEGGTISNDVIVADATVDGQITLSAVPIGPSGVALTRKIYRTPVDGDGSVYKFDGELDDNTTTVYTTNVADASLGASCPLTNTTSVLSASGSGIVARAPLYLPTGSVAVPSLSFPGDITTGIYQGGVARLDVTIAGVEALLLAGSNSAVGTLRMGTGSIGFSANFSSIEVLLQRLGANIVGLSAGTFVGNNKFALGTTATAGKVTVGTGDPNSVVTGSVGDLFVRTDGGAATTLYVKESGSVTNTGWVGK